MMGSQVPACAQRPYLLQEPGRHHGRKAFLESVVQCGTVRWHERPLADQPTRKRAHGVPLKLRDRLASGETYLERPLDPLTVVRGNAGGGFGIESRQLRVEGRPTLLPRTGIELRPQLGSGGG